MIGELPPVPGRPLLATLFGGRAIPPGANAGLVFDRYLRIWAAPDRVLRSPPSRESMKSPNVADDLQRFVSDYEGLRAATEPLLRDAHARLEAIAPATATTVRFTSRFVSGLGGAHPLENGFTFDRNVGVPVIAGSGVKGLCRAQAKLEGLGKQTIRRLFGPDMDEGAHAIGGLVFMPALPAAWPKLEVDIVNCHHPRYMDRKLHDPVDVESPVPVPFLTVAAGTDFVFRLFSRVADKRRRRRKASDSCATRWRSSASAPRPPWVMGPHSPCHREDFSTSKRRTIVHPYLRLQVLIRPLDDDRPAPSGGIGGGGTAELAAPLVRRVLGMALIDLFCPFGQPHCEAPRQRGGAPVPPAELCHLAESCPYGVLFAGSRSGRPPYAVYVPNDPDDHDLIEITLFGPAWRFYPWLLQALRKALRAGLGKERRKFDVHRVYRTHPDSSRAEICSADLSELLPTLPPDLLEVSIRPEPSPPAPLPRGEGSAEEPFPTRRGPVEVHLLSPTRLIHDGKLHPGHRPVPFALLVARILDRFRGLFGDAASEILRPEIRRAVEAEAARVPLVSDETKWIEVEDYSARGRSELLLGGKVGRLIYGVEAARFLPILRAGEILHVGKNPTSGCGRLGVVSPEVVD